MKDDSLSDVAHRYGFGDLYDKVAEYDDSFAKAHAKIDPDSVGKQEPSPDKINIHITQEAIAKLQAANEQENVYAKQIWNDAIEAAANVSAKNREHLTAFEIRKLKK